MDIAQRITTPHEWDESTLGPQTRAEIEKLVMKPGFRALFDGPSGTGKTLAAGLLSDATGLPVFRIDVSIVVSEHSLSDLFDQAAQQGWVLYFDEADSLFGKRTESRNANDRAANQQIAYLLQRIEDFPGVIILATNLRSHLDEAFARRFEAVIHFPNPDRQ